MVFPETSVMFIAAASKTMLGTFACKPHPILIIKYGLASIVAVARLSYVADNSKPIPHL